MEVDRMDSLREGGSWVFILEAILPCIEENSGKTWWIITTL